jgi:hypothetical protein
MAWKKVASYSFGFGQSDKKFWVYYTLEGSGTAYQIFLTPTQFTALAQLLSSGAAINFETTGNYFATAPRSL